MEPTFSRGGFVRRAGVAVAGLSFGGALAGLAHAADPILTPAAALRRLLAGNARYVALKATHPNQSGERRQELAGGQQPFATIFGCVDSRVPPELVFDQGLGDLFVIRTAGEVVDDAALGSIEFGVEEFHIPLVVVLGHQKCGAVAATFDALEKHAKAPGKIDYLVREIEPAVKAVEFHAGDKLDNAVRAHTALTAHRLGESKVLEEGLKAGWLKILGAHYDLDSGKVEVVAA